MNMIKKTAVIGAGLMGAEIAYCFAYAGIDVVLKDTSLNLAVSGKKRIEGILSKGCEKGFIDETKKNETLEKILPSDADEDAQSCDLLIEAVFEDEAVKKQTLSRFDAICKPSCIFASNTSSIPITKLATAVDQSRIPQFIGTHFFSPVSRMKLVEVIPGLKTTQQTIDAVMECCRRIGKTPIQVKDVPGFAVNRILHAMWIECNRLLEEGVASVDDIDLACQLGLGHPIGPYALMDLTTNTLNLQVQEILFEAYGERFRPRPILKQMVNANHNGKKCGQGWRNYQK